MVYGIGFTTCIHLFGQLYPINLSPWYTISFLGSIWVYKPTSLHFSIKDTKIMIINHFLIIPEGQLDGSLYPQAINIGFTMGQ